MTNEYTPTDEDIRSRYAQRTNGLRRGLGLGFDEFDRWLAAHDAGVRATALEEGWDAGYVAGCEDGWDGGRYGIYDTNRVTENPFRAVQENPGKDN